ncbi:MAG: C10 family peptidase [Candidatus Cloacimonetes bacterium]|nr:C10 family peptidase [Candidatus Cloacimonadota bacterium]
MKYLSTFNILILFFNTILAEIVHIDSAEKIATNWMKYIDANNSKIINSFFFENDNQTTMYYFSFAPEGFVILSADDNSYPILAYSDKGEIKEDTIPPATSQMLQYYSDQIAYIIENNIQNQENLDLWTALDNKDFSLFSNRNRDVSPMFNTEWDQGSPYNMYCPLMSGQHTLVGCVAVAMGQIMKYHNYPEQGDGEHSYTWNGQTISANFGETNYDWTNMPNYLYYSSPTIQKQAVATLLYHCGIASNMDYGLDGSGTSSGYADNALKHFFSYSYAMDLINKDSYPIDEFLDMLITSLENNQPLYYAGSDETAGHAFVFDGFQNNFHFHVNWGWSGSYDGYFYISDLTPGYYNFNYYQQAIVNIRPPLTAYPPQNLTATPMGTDVLLMWELPIETNGLTGYKLYRNDELISELNGEEVTSYFDFALSGGEYTYYVTSQYFDSDSYQPESEASNQVTVEIGTNTPEDVIGNQDNRLLGNYPNPFNPETVISFELNTEDADNAKIEIYNLKGQRVKTFSNLQMIKSPNQQIVWDGKDKYGEIVPSGVLFYQLSVNNKIVSSKKMILIK